MRLFDEIKVDQAAGTVELGAGLTSGVVYKKLEPLNINVMAPSDPNVGIAGSTLGGGECLLSLGGPMGSEMQTTCRLWFDEQPIWPRH